jgi:hypothetical protein
VRGTRLVDEMSQGTGIRSLSEPVVFPRPRTIGKSRRSLVWLRKSPATRYLQLMVPETLVELLAARFTKYHSSFVSWSFPMSGPCP